MRKIAVLLRLAVFAGLGAYGIDLISRAVKSTISLQEAAMLWGLGIILIVAGVLGLLQYIYQVDASEGRVKRNIEFLNKRV